MYEKTLAKAISLLKRWKIPYVEDDKIIDLFKNSFESKPMIRPYHIDYPNEDILRLIIDKKLEVYVEAKHDGTHIQLCKNGIFKHDGKPVSNDQLAGLLHIAYDNPQLIEKILDAVRRGYVVEIELFGSKYTPMGFHLNHPKMFDLIVFEIGLNDCWFPPPEKYTLLEDMELPFPNYVELKPTNIESFKKKLEELASRKDFYEGAVAKANAIEAKGYRVRQFIKNGLIIFKVKVKKPIIKSKKKVKKKVVKKVEIKLPKQLAMEIDDEVVKLFKMERELFKSRKNIPVIIKRVMEYLKDSHPHLLEGVEEREVRKYIAKRILEILS